MRQRGVRYLLASPAVATLGLAFGHEWMRVGTMEPLQRDKPAANESDNGQITSKQAPKQPAPAIGYRAEGKAGAAPGVAEAARTVYDGFARALTWPFAPPISAH